MFSEALASTPGQSFANKTPTYSYSNGRGLSAERVFSILQATLSRQQYQSLENVNRSVMLQIVHSNVSFVYMEFINFKGLCN